MKKQTISMLAAVALAATIALPLEEAHAQSDAVRELAAPPPIQLPLKPSPEYAKFPQYAGTLGKRQIVLRLGKKTDPDDAGGVHGEYQFADTGEVILIAGDRDGDTLEVEESNDGTHITGNWVGKFAADGSVEGERMNVDDSDPQEFSLKPLGASQAGQAAPAVPQQNAQKPAAQSSGHAVNGVSNLNTGE